MSHAHPNIRVEPIAGALGAEVLGVDLSEDLSEATIAQIRQAFLDHLVIFFRDQTLTPDQQLAFGRRFGEIIEYPFVKGIEGHPLIIPVVKLPDERVNFGGIWHSDTTYLAEPPMGTMLLAREVPPYGGDTEFANQYLAYETLSEGMRNLLDPLYAVSSSAKADVSKSREDRMRDAPGGKAGGVLEAEHPVVRTHPETGRKALYVSVAHTSRFRGMTEAESKPLLEFLHKHQSRPEITCRFRWREGSMAFWDNRCAMHNPINDYHGHKRVMHRITLKGDVPR